MKVYEFRKELKNCFDAALHGDIVEIERGGVSYSLTAKTLSPITDAMEVLNNAGFTGTMSRDKLKQCKLHFIPLDNRGRCLQKECRYN